MIKKFLKYIYLFILIELIIFVFLNYISGVKKEVVLNKQLSMLKIQYNATFNSYKDLTTCFFNAVINKREVIDIFKEAYSNPTKRDSLRDKLFNLLKVDYKNLKKLEIAQLHFHFKDGISFLRFHKPSKYGDFLFSTRESIKIVNEKKRYLNGFEVGKHYGSYRFIFPIFDEKNEHFGSVEVALPSILFMSKMNLTYPSHIHFIIKKDLFDKKIVKDEKKYFTKSDLSKNFVFERKLKIDKLEYESLHQHINGKIVSKFDKEIKDEIKDKLNFFKPFAISKYIKGSCYIASFLPIENIEKKSIAYIISYVESKELLDIKNSFFIQFIIFTLFNLILILYIYKISKTKELQELKEKFEIIFNNANDGIVLVDIKTKKFLMCNNKMQEMLNYSEDEMRNLTIFEINDKSEYLRLEENIKKLINGKKIVVPNALLKRKDNSKFYTDVTASIKMINDKYYVVGIFRDISERKNFEDELKTININLENRVKEEVSKSREKDRIMFEQAKLAQMGEMLAMIAHQWRQPINAISAASLNINVKQQLGDLSDEFIIEQTEFIQKETQIMSSIIDDFINFFKSKKNRVKFKLIDSFEEIFNLIKAQLKSKNIEYNYQVDESLEVYGYKSDLEHVLINILSNARDAFDSLKINDKKYINIKVTQIDKFIEIKIEDNAGGVPKEVMDKIFNPYFSTKDEGKGLGIGLYMCKSIIEKNFGGNLNFEVIDSKTIFNIKIQKA